MIAPSSSSLRTTRFSVRRRVHRATDNSSGRGTQQAAADLETSLFI